MCSRTSRKDGFSGKALSEGFVRVGGLGASVDEKPFGGIVHYGDTRMKGIMLDLPHAIDLAQFLA